MNKHIFLLIFVLAGSCKNEKKDDFFDQKAPISESFTAISETDSTSFADHNKELDSAETINSDEKKKFNEEEYKKNLKLFYQEFYAFLFENFNYPKREDLKGEITMFLKFDEKHRVYPVKVYKTEGINDKELARQLEEEAFRVFNLMRDRKSWEFMQPGMTLIGGVTIPKPDSIPKFEIKLGDN